MKAVFRRCSVKQILLKISEIHRKIPVPESLLNKLQSTAFNFIEKETLAQVFSCEFYEIFENTFFIEQIRWLLLIKKASYLKKLSRFWFWVDCKELNQLRQISALHSSVETVREDLSYSIFDQQLSLSSLIAIN